MEKLIYTYALIKSLYDEGGDYIDSFWPFVIMSLQSTISLSLEKIQAIIRKNNGMGIPLHVLKTILNRAKRNGFIEKSNSQYKLTNQGIQFLNKIESSRNVERRINALLEDIKNYFLSNNISLEKEEIYKLIISFLNNNIEPLIEFINPNVPVEVEFNSDIRLLVDYIKQVEEQNPEHYKTLENLILGSIISTILYSEDSSELVELSSQKFKSCQVFLDTNFIFSILEMHDPSFNEPAKELLKILNQYKFNLKVFDFTVNEITRVMEGYINEAYKYPATIGVNTIYSNLKRNKWTRTDAREFIIKIEEILFNKNIKFEWTNLDIRNLKISSELVKSINDYKENQDILSRNHDLAAIEKIREIRKKPVRKIENSKAIFLTSDVKLCLFNYNEFGHKLNGTVCEVILDRLLTNILWLKNPSTNLPIKTIIAAYSQDLLIQRNVWDRFYEILKKLRGEKKIDDEKISMLFYHGYIEESLKGLDEDDLDRITPDFVLKEAEKAARVREMEVNEIIKEKEEEFLRKLNIVTSQREKEVEERWLKKLEKVKEGLKISSEKEARRAAIIVATILTIIIFIMICFVINILKNKKWSHFFILIPIIIGSGGIFEIWTKLKDLIERKYFEKKYSKKLKEANLQPNK